ncbi:MAG: PD40 domain-containing protein, partial [Anaerolineales bacterium]|nr:PD40 domain-containing protein [Anaerolineales bacterium]
TRQDNLDPTDPETLIPDTSGAAGFAHYMQAVNKYLALYRKDGTLIDSNDFNSFWGNVNTNTACDGERDAHHGQPYLLFDHLAGRWVVADVAYEDIDNGPYYICVAVSKPVDEPLFVADNWYHYAISTGENPAPYYPDMPKLGLWPDGIYMSADLYDVESNGTSWNPRGVKVWALNRSDLINGQEGAYRKIDFSLPDYLSYEHLVPTNLLGNPPAPGTPNYFASIQQINNHFIELYIWEFQADWSNLFASTFGVTLEPNFTETVSGSLPVGSIIPQANTSERVEAHGSRLMSPLQYRILDGLPSLWATHAVVTSAPLIGLRWYELQFDTNGDPAIYQNGTYQPDSSYRWLSSLATDRTGNMAIGFSRSASTESPSIAYAGRLRQDPLNSLAQGEAYLYPQPGDLTGSQMDGDPYQDGPWGRQSQMSVDPLDECVFWYTNMYYSETVTATVNLDWNTRIGWFSFPDCKGGSTTRVSLHTNNTQGNLESGLDYEMYSVAISDIGRYVAFSSEASSLVDGDTNGHRDIFLRDRDVDNDGIFDEPGAVRTIRVSNGYNGSQANGDSWEVSISYNGRYIAYSSEANNLVPSDFNGVKDIFVYDRNTGQTQRVSVADLSGVEAANDSDQPFISGDGRTVAFRSFAENLVPSDTNLVADIFIHTMATGRTRPVSIQDTTGTPANGASAHPSLSEDGRYVAFSSIADNLIGAGNDTNGFRDIFVHDRDTHSTIRVSVSTGGAESSGHSYTPYISGDGVHVVFASMANNLDEINADTNGIADIFVHDIVPAETYRVSVSFFGVEAVGGNSYSPSISRDGRYIAFASEALNLDVTVPDINNRRDVFLHDRSLALQGIYDNGLTNRISLTFDRRDPAERSFAPVVAPFGRHVAFVSEASNLVTNDTNGYKDVFAYDSEYSVPIFLSIPANIPANPGDTVSVPILFNGDIKSIDSTTFSVDFDEECLMFDASDADHNGIPDNIHFSLPADFVRAVTFYPDDLDGEIDFWVYDQTAPRMAIPTGTLATIEFQVKATCQAAPDSSRSARVGFSNDPAPSFGSYGISIPGIALDGFVRILPGSLGDCNGDGLVNAGDLSALVLEIFDGDDNRPADTPGGTFPGNAVGCNPNQDYVVDAADISCTVMVIWGGGSAGCTGVTANSHLGFQYNPLLDTKLSLPAAQGTGQ